MSSFTDFKALSFDCYGTLIDWESGIYESFQPLLSQLPPTHSYREERSTCLARFNEFQVGLETEQPNLVYRDILSSCYGKLASELGIFVTEEEKTAFGASVPTWKAFPDTVEGLKSLVKHYKLIILSNVDHESVEGTLTGPLSGVKFDAVYTAQDVGSYKPNHKNFTYLLEHLKSDFGLEKKDLLHTAKSLPVDHVPAKDLDLTSVWIARGIDGVSGMGGNPRDLKDMVSYSWRFPTIGAMAVDVDKSFSKQ